MPYHFYMNKLLIALGITGLLAAGCKETAPFIALGKVNFYDSTYTLTKIPPADKHNVLMEEFTGATCTNCPAAHKTLEALEKSHEGRLNVVGLYLYNINQTTPPKGAAYDFRDSTATSMSTALYNAITSLPNGGVDRVKQNSVRLIAQGNWSSTIADRLNMPTPVNMQIKSNFTGSSSKITVSLTYTTAVPDGHKLSVMIVEDSIVDKQDFPAFDPNFPSGVDDAYVFTNVFRQLVSTPPFGDAIPGTKGPGFTVVRTYVYDARKDIKPEHCRAIAFITSEADQTVVQSVQTSLQ